MTLLFNVGDHVVYPSHGVGMITSEEIQIVTGANISVYVIHFSRDKMTLKVPKARACKIGLRHVSSIDEFNRSFDILKGKTKAFLKGAMWSKRAQEYMRKINSGNLKDIAEVVQELHKNVDDPERSHSEKIIYDSALGRFVNEYAVVMRLDVISANQKILATLNYFKD